MVPHERSLVKRLEGQPFTLLGINNDRRLEEARAKNLAIGLNWRNWWDPENLISTRWNVPAWPTLYLLDHRGVVRRRWFGDPGDRVMDKAIQALVAEAKAEDKIPGSPGRRGH